MSRFALYLACLLVAATIATAQPETSKPIDSTNVKVFLSLPTYHSLSACYLKRSPSIFDYRDLKNDGNNFIGIEVTPGIQLANVFSLEAPIAFQFGNIQGNFIGNMSLMPRVKYTIGMFSSFQFNLYAGAGPTFLSANEDKKELGGYGLGSLLGVGFYIYKNFYINMNWGFESYSKAAYNTFGMGVAWREDFVTYSK